MIVSGDLTGTSDAERTVQVQIIGPFNTAQAGSDFELLGTFIVPEANYADASAFPVGYGSFDLTQYGSDGQLVSVTGDDPVLSIFADNLFEGKENLEIEIAALGTSLQQGDVDRDSIVQEDTEHIIADSATATITLVSRTVGESGVAENVTVELTTDDGSGNSAVLAPGVSLAVDINELANGTADNPSDYAFASGQSVTFGAGDGDGTSQTLSIVPVDDAIVENDETVNFDVTNLVGQAPLDALGNSMLDTQVTLVDGTVTIVNDDGPAAIAISDVTVDESAGTVTITATLDQQVQGGVTADVVFTNGTAGSADFTGTTNSISFPGGAVGETATITIDITDDLVVEDSENFEISLTNIVSAGTTNAGSATVTIADNDGPATIALGDITVNEADGTVVVTATLDTAVQGGVTADVVFTDGTAGSGDFTGITGSVSFVGNANETAVISIDIADDSLVESTENLTVSLVNVVAGAGAINAISPATVTIVDNDSASVTLSPVVTGASEQPVGTGVTNGEFTIDLSNASDTDTVVTFAATPDSNSIQGAIREGFETSSLSHLQGDYRILADGVVVTGNTITIPAGQTSVDITIEVIDDGVVEVAESFDFTLTGVSSTDPEVTLAAGQTSNITITDDDQAEIIVKAVQDANEPGQDADDNGFFQVLLVVPGSVDTANPFGIPAPVSYDVEVLFSTTGTANQLPGDPNNPVDFEELVQVEFAPGITTDVIAVTPEDDLLVEGDETVTINLVPNSVESNILDNLFDQNVTEVAVTNRPAHQSATVVIEDNDVDAPAPHVEGIYVNGTNWTSLFRDRVDGVEDGSTFGYELTNRADEVNVPWINVDQIIVEFDSPIDSGSIDATDFGISGDLGFGAGLTPDILSATAGPGNTVILTLDGFLEPANVTLDINGTGLQTSGVNGTDSSFSFVSLPGDTNSDNTVSPADIDSTVDRQFAFILPGNLSFGGYEFSSDLNGDGTISPADIDAATDRQFDFVLPSISGSSLLATSVPQANFLTLSEDSSQLSGAVELQEEQQDSRFDSVSESDVNDVDDVFSQGDFDFLSI